MLGLVPAPERAVVPLGLFQSAEAKVFWQLAEEVVVVYSLVVAAAAEPCALQRRPRPAVGVTESVTPAVWESERCLVSAPVAPQLAEAPTGAAARVD